jgi:hypothetical protein
MMCIWCKQVRQPAAVEHIIPDSLGCPPDLIFRKGEVCQRCNNRFSALDQAIVADFELFKFWSGVPSKGKRLPTIATRGNIVGRYVTPDHAEIFMNMDPKSVRTHDGRVVGPFKGTARNVTGTMKDLDGGMASGTIRQHGVCNSKSAIRGLHKIALEVLAFYLGVDEACKSAYDSVRVFVRKGKGRRVVLLLPCGDSQYRNEVIRPCGPTDEQCVVGFRLGAVRFVVDLSHDQHFIDILRSICRSAYGSNWTWVPIDEKVT